MDHGYYMNVGHHGPHVLGWLFFFLVLALAIMALTWFFMRMTGRAPVQSVGAPAGAGPNAALEIVRLRYARGEIDRDEFVRVSGDLGGEPPPA